MGSSNVALKMELNPGSVTEELAAIQEANGGMLDPVMVVEYARNPDTFLHSKFQWDDTKAAAQYRIWQARKIISYEMVVIKEDRGEVRVFTDVREEGGKIVRAYVSLAGDRGVGGYRGMVDVMSDADMKAQLLEEARNDMKLFRRKYDALTALSKVFAAMEEV